MFRKNLIKDGLGSFWSFETKISPLCTPKKRLYVSGRGSNCRSFIINSRLLILEHTKAKFEVKVLPVYSAEPGATIQSKYQTAKIQVGSNSSYPLLHNDYPTAWLCCLSSFRVTVPVYLVIARSTCHSSHNNIGLLVVTHHMANKSTFSTFGNCTGRLLKTRYIGILIGLSFYVTDAFRLFRFFSLTAMYSLFPNLQENGAGMLLSWRSESQTTTESFAEQTRVRNWRLRLRTRISEKKWRKTEKKSATSKEIVFLENQQYP